MNNGVSSGELASLRKRCRVTGGCGCGGTVVTSVSRLMGAEVVILQTTGGLSGSISVSLIRGRSCRCCGDTLRANRRITCLICSGRAFVNTNNIDFCRIVPACRGPANGGTCVVGVCATPTCQERKVTFRALSLLMGSMEGRNMSRVTLRTARVKQPLCRGCKFMGVRSRVRLVG